MIRGSRRGREIKGFPGDVSMVIIEMHSEELNKE